MKRILCVLSAAFLVLTSCSNDDNSSKGDDSSKPAAVLVKKFVYTEKNGTYTDEVVYEGNKITTITNSDGGGVKFTYDGNVITKIESFDEDGELYLLEEYTYNKEKLSTSIRKEIGYKFYYKTNYTHNADGTISYEEIEGTVETGSEEKTGQTGKYTYANGNLIKNERFGKLSESVTTYEYDDKNNPYKNIIGFSLLLNKEKSNYNNPVKRTSDQDSSTTYEYKYDNSNYPTEQVISHSEKSVSPITVQFEY